MTTEELKELYATGECSKCKLTKESSEFRKDKNRTRGYDACCKQCRLEESRTIEGVISKIYLNQVHNSKAREHIPPTYTKEQLRVWLMVSQSKFIELFDAWVLSGYKSSLKPSQFFEHYNSGFTYEIIKDKPSLKGNYCLATKEHYDKLVEDGYAYFKRWCDANYYGVEGQTFQNFSLETKDMTPMHLHNNEWVFGSLEHEPNHANFIKEVEKICEEPKPVERITREDIQYLIDECDSDVIKYIKQLEANQKE